MKHGIYDERCKGKTCSLKNRPIKIIGISSGKRDMHACAREDPVSLFYLKFILEEIKKQGVNTELIDLRRLKINPCKECYSTNPAQCRFNEKTNQCDCYQFKKDYFYYGGKFIKMEEAYDKLNKKDFFRIYNSEEEFAERDDMWKIYKALLESDGIIFATSTAYYSRPALLQTMFSRLCALDGGVEELWGDGKNLGNSIKYSKNLNAKYKQRLYGKFCAFINCSKEGDSVTPDLIKACIMVGMKTIPLGIVYRVNWYDDPTHRLDTLKSKQDKYTLSLIKHMAKKIVEEIKNSPRVYGKYTKTV